MNETHRCRKQARPREEAVGGRIFLSRRGRLPRFQAAGSLARAHPGGLPTRHSVVCAPSAGAIVAPGDRTDLGGLLAHAWPGSQVPRPLVQTVRRGEEMSFNDPGQVPLVCTLPSSMEVSGKVVLRETGRTTTTSVHILFAGAMRVTQRKEIRLWRDHFGLHYRLQDRVRAELRPCWAAFWLEMAGRDDGLAKSFKPYRPYRAATRDDLEMFLEELSRPSAQGLLRQPAPKAVTERPFVLGGRKRLLIGNRTRTATGHCRCMPSAALLVATAAMICIGTLSATISFIDSLNPFANIAIIKRHSLS